MDSRPRWTSSRIAISNRKKTLLQKSLTNRTQASPGGSTPPPILWIAEGVFNFFKFNRLRKLRMLSFCRTLSTSFGSVYFSFKHFYYSRLTTKSASCKVAPKDIKRNLVRTKTNQTERCLAPGRDSRPPETFPGWFRHRPPNHAMRLAYGLKCKTDAAGTFSLPPATVLAGALWRPQDHPSIPPIIHRAFQPHWSHAIWSWRRWTQIVLPASKA